MTVYKYYPGYRESIKNVEQQSLEDDLKMIDDFYGRDNLEYGASPADVKEEALRQLEIEFRDCVDEDQTFYSDLGKALAKQNSYG